MKPRPAAPPGSSGCINHLLTSFCDTPCHNLRMCEVHRNDFFLLMACAAVAAAMASAPPSLRGSHSAIASVWPSPITETTTFAGVEPEPRAMQP